MVYKTVWLNPILEAYWLKKKLLKKKNVKATGNVESRNQTSRFSTNTQNRLKLRGKQQLHPLGNCSQYHKLGLVFLSDI